MLEVSADPATRRAIATAHQKRGAAVADVWAWLLGGRTR